MRKNIVRTGATAFNSPIPIAATVNNVLAQRLLAPVSSCAKTCKNGNVPSLAIACNNRVADTKLCNAAPIILAIPHD